MSTHATRSGRTGTGTSTGAGILALVTSFLVVLSGLFVAPAAFAADGPSATAAVTAADTTGFSVKVDFENIPASTLPTPQNMGVYGALVETGTDTPLGGGNYVHTSAMPGGTGSVSFVTKVSDGIDRSKSYEALIWYAHGNPTPNAIVLRVPVTLSDAEWDAIFPPATPEATTVSLSSSAASVEAGTEVAFTSTVAPAAAAGTVTFTSGGSPLGDAVPVSAGEATHSTASLAIGTHEIVASFTPADASAFATSISNAVSVTVTEASAPEVPVFTPEVQVYAADGQTPVDASTALYSGDEIIVKGTGFDPASNLATRPAPITLGDPAGNYVVFGNFASEWKPSAGIASSKRVVATQKWALTDATYGNIAAKYLPAVEGDRIALAADGSFEAKLKLKDLAADKTAPEGGTFGVFTYAGGGPTNAAQELELRLNYKGERPVYKPVMEVYAADGITPIDASTALYADDEIVVKGTGFDPSSNLSTRPAPITLGDPAGNYVVFGNFASDWKPSAGAATNTRVVATQKWALTDATYGNIAAKYLPAVEGDRVTLAADGSFEAKLKLKDLAADKTAPEGGTFGVFTYAGGGPANAAQELELRLNYKGENVPDPEIPETTVGGLDWAFNTGWNFYAKNIAGATITATNGATVNAAGLANYTQVEGGNYDAQAGVGSIHYEGIVRYVSELHSFDIAIKNPQITFTSRTTATMTAELSNSDIGGVSDMSRVTMAILTPGAPAGAVGELQTWANVPGVFAESIHPEGWADYAGKNIAPLTYTYGASKPAEPEDAVGGLDWAFNTSWNFYAKNIAGAAISASNGATVDDKGNANYTQVKGGDFDAKTGLGSIHYQGTVKYESTAHFFSIALKDPQITFTSKTTATLTAEVSDSDTDGANKMTRIAFATLTANASTESADGLLNWADVTGVFATPIQPEGWEPYAGKATAPLSFSYGAEKGDIPVTPEVPTTPTKPVTPTPAPNPVGASQQAGSLSWGISSGFAAYAVGNISKGSVSTNGVGSSGGAYLFPQANGGAWNKDTQTGSVQFSGVVTFTGHKGLMTEIFANPVITVTSATEGTISSGGRTFGLNLGSASKSVGANGEVTWSGVPVSGSIAGGGSAGGAAGSGSFSADPLSFTVGAASGVQYGSTSQTEQKPAREAAATAPATTGITVVTPKEDIVPGGEIEFSAEGFEASERDILVVLYSDPIVLDRKAGANADGKVTWIGTLPEDLEPGKHTITLQGSKNAGAVITVVDPDKKVVKADTLAKSSSGGQQGLEVASAGVNAGPVWLWWIGAGALVLLAGATGGLVVLQRRRNSAV